MKDRSKPKTIAWARIAPLLALMAILCLTNFQLFAQSPCSSLTGGGTTNFLPLWTTGCNLGNSNVFQSGGKVGIGTTNPGALLDVNGNINTNTAYQIGQTIVLSTGSHWDYSLFLGEGAGVNNVAGSGVYNLFSGQWAGYSNTIGYQNIFEGGLAGYFNTSGYMNVFIGASAGYSNTSGKSNIFVGDHAGYSNTTSTDNIFIGTNAGTNHTIGTSNIFMGSLAGTRNNTGNYNIYIENQGNSVNSGESSTIRIGDPTNQHATFIAGIYGVNAGGVPVSINANGQLGTTSSSRRFKDNILDMNDSSSKLYQLRPVTFNYKPQYDDGPHSLQYGLIAEEVANVYPEMVAYDKDGKPYTVKYQLLPPMLLNELQKEHKVVSEQQDLIQTQQQQLQTVIGEMADLQKQLSRLESLTAKK